MMAEYKDSEESALEQMSEGPGKIAMADEVIQTITAMEAINIKGLWIAGPKKKIYDMISGKKDLTKYVQVKVNENHVTIGISIEVEYGQNIYEMSRALQRRIKNAVESMTGKIVDQVNVMVDGIRPIEMEKHEEETAQEDQ